MKAENKKSRAYRYKTLEEIAEVLQENKENMNFERCVGNDNVPAHYYIHISEDDFSFVGSCDWEVESFSAPYYGECDDSFEWETLENRDFRNVCYDLLEQVNTYIREEMEFRND